MDTEGEGFLKKLSRNYTLYYHMKPEHYNLQNHFEVLSASPKENLARIYHYYLKNKSRRRTSDLGHGGKAVIKGELSTEGKRNADAHTGFANNKNSKAIFKKM